jgi:hypothetical protein
LIVLALLAQHSGRCHPPNLPTSVPRALAIFDLTDESWYGGLQHDPFDDLLKSLRSIKSLPAEDTRIIQRFVLCARDGDCPPADR